MRLRLLAFLLLFSILFYSVSSQKIFFDLTEKIANLTSDVETARKKKKGGKMMSYILFGSLLIKSIIFPLAFKAMAVMSGISVLLSTMSLIMSSIVAYVKLAKYGSSPVKVVHKSGYNSWAKDDKNIKNSYDVENSDPPPYPFQ